MSTYKKTLDDTVTSLKNYAYERQNSKNNPYSQKPDTHCQVVKRLTIPAWSASIPLIERSEVRNNKTKVRMPPAGCAVYGVDMKQYACYAEYMNNTGIRNLPRWFPIWIGTGFPKTTLEAYIRLGKRHLFLPKALRIDPIKKHGIVMLDTKGISRHQFYVIVCYLRGINEHYGLMDILVDLVCKQKKPFWPSCIAALAIAVKSGGHSLFPGVFTYTSDIQQIKNILKKIDSFYVESKSVFNLKTFVKILRFDKSFLKEKTNWQQCVGTGFSRIKKESSINLSNLFHPQVSRGLTMCTTPEAFQKLCQEHNLHKPNQRENT